MAAISRSSLVQFSFPWGVGAALSWEVHWGRDQLVLKPNLLSGNTYSLCILLFREGAGRVNHP